MDQSSHIIGSMEEPSTQNAAVIVTERISALIDEENNARIAHGLGISDTSLSRNSLSKVLGPNSFVQAPSNLPKLLVTTEASDRIRYRTIGFGQCGIIFERPGYDYVLKVARPFFEDSLWNDFICHLQIWRAFESQNLSCRVPRPFSYVTKTNANWWNETMPLLDGTWRGSFPLPAMTLVSERIIPLPSIVRQVLIDEYCPEGLKNEARVKSSNRDCLARIYLGRRRPKDQPLPPNFTLRNFNLHLDQMQDLGLDVAYFAAIIGEALAVVHWSARVDAYDIEFVLGSDRQTAYGLFPSLDTFTTQEVQEMEPHTDLESMMQTRLPRLATRPWILDFNLCSTWKEEIESTEPDAMISQLVLAFFENDPYYPIPLADLEVEQRLWNVFSASYLSRADVIVSDRDPCRRSLPHKFITACIERERDSLQRGLGHGHRQYRV